MRLGLGHDTFVVEALERSQSQRGSMRKSVKIGAAALMMTCMAGNLGAAAATAAGCARPEDMTAIKTAAIQQRLMVAALSCDAAQLYNNFVRSYQKDLQASDRALQNFFRRLNGRNGEENYHAFKTRLANASSMQSIGDITGYCASAKQVFAAALDAPQTSLTVFISGQSTSADNTFSPCQVRTASAAETFSDSDSDGPETVPLPHFKPGTIILWTRHTTVAWRNVTR
jgi:hypothetical protein